MTRFPPFDDASDARDDANFRISDSSPLVDDGRADDGRVDVGRVEDGGAAARPGDGPAPPEPDASTFLVGPEAVRAFIAREWKRQLDYRLKKEVWTYSGDQVSILFDYEWHDAESGRWISTCGEEHWEIAPDGLLRRLSANGRDIVISDVVP